MQKWLLCDVPSKSYELLNITMYGTHSNNFTEIWDVNILIYPYFYHTGANQKASVP